MPTTPTVIMFGARHRTWGDIMQESRPHGGNDVTANKLAPSILRMQSRDVTVVLQRMRQLYGVDTKAQVADNLDWHAEIISLGPLTLIRGSTDTPSSLTAGIERHIILMTRSNTIGVQTPGADLPAVAATSGVIASPGKTITADFPPELRSLNLVIDPAFLTRQLEALTGQPMDEAVDFQASLDLTSGAGALLHQTCHYLSEEALRDGKTIPPSLAGSLSEGLSRALLASHPHNQSYLLEKPPPPSSRTVVRLVEEYVDAHATEPIVAMDLARITGVGVASIEAAFLQYRRMTPTAFLKARRLENARRALFEDSHVTNHGAALLAGYVGVAAFEAAYFKQYGEMPSETRQRGFMKHGGRLPLSAGAVPEPRVELLSEREREVCNWVAKGLLNKQIAGEMGITQKTVQDHRGRAMQKLGIQSAAELARLWERLGK